MISATDAQMLQLARSARLAIDWKMETALSVIGVCVINATRSMAFVTNVSLATTLTS